MNETELNDALNELKKDRERFNFVYARSDGLSVEASLKAAGRSKAWFYSLPKSEQEQMENLASELNAAAKLKARRMIDEAVVTAVEVKIAGLRSRNENVKQGAATEIIDRSLGKVSSNVDITSGGVPIEVVLKWPEDKPE